MGNDNKNNTMSSDRRQPELSVVDGYNRKFGRYDFKRFDNLAPLHASLGAASLGKIHVDCRFLFKKSKWGTLGDRDSAGIVYLDLAFNQPSDCRLKSATVRVTLDDDDKRLVRQFPLNGSNPPVQIVKFGPRQITGAPHFEQITSHNTCIPSIQVGSIGGAGGVGGESTKVRVRECRWTFEGHPMPGDRKRGNSWAYKTIQWQITENELAPQSLHSNTVHTAFSFVHGGQPFFMRVEVSGKLESRLADLKHQIKYRMTKLKFPANPQSSRCATTLIDFKGQHKLNTTPLDGLVHGLELAMEYDNMTAPVEVEGPQRPTFFENQQPASVPKPRVGQPSDTQPLVEGFGNQNATTVENIASRSAKWLSPPEGLSAPVLDSDAYRHAPGIPPETAQPHHRGFQHQSVNITVMEANIEGLDSTIASPETESEQGARFTPVVIHPNSFRVSADQLGLGAIIILIRMWMVQKIAILFGYSSIGSNQPQTAE